MRNLLLLFLLCLTCAANAEPVSVDLLIEGGAVVTMDARGTLHEEGYVAIRGGRIVAMGPGKAAIRAKEVIDAHGQAVLPGLVNVHTHVPMTLFRGLSDDVQLDDWLEHYIFPAEAKNVTSDFVRTGSRLAMAEMIRGGTTTFCDMYYFEDTVAEEARQAGLRGVLAQCVLDFPAPDLDLWEEMDTAAKLHKVFTHDPTVLSAREALTMGTIGGAKALHLENEIGSLEIGKRADVIVVDLEAPHVVPRYDLYSHLVYAVKASDVTCTIVEGRVLMRNRRVLTVDVKSTRQAAQTYREQVSRSLR